MARINTNIAAVTAQRHLGRASADLNETLTRLSSQQAPSVAALTRPSRKVQMTRFVRAQVSENSLSILS